jgi:hypothetical protein
MSGRPLARWIGTAGAVLSVAAAVSAVDATPAAAAGPMGYVRLAHLSPDTPNVDVYLSTVGGSGAPQVFPGVGYGVVSKYLSVPTGTYAVAMRGAGAPATDPPVLTTNVTVNDGKAYMVAGVGKHADLGLKVIEDDLTPPPSGKAKVRVVQASLRAPALDLSIQGGAMIAGNVPFASTTEYFQVQPGRWTLKAQGTTGGPAGNLGVHLEAGDVYSVLVLDAPGGGLKSELRLDAAGMGQPPTGGVQTGAGGTRRGPDQRVPLGVALAVLLGAAGFGIARYRRARAR